MVKLINCHSETSGSNERKRIDAKHLTIALAGNANVGKSVVFNQLTGSHQIIGNWPGKTVERAEGTIDFEEYNIAIIDLPGIYSFSTFSLEEFVAREYIAHEKPDVVINVVDASVLERNLFFTLQLKETEVPLVICLNQMDMAKKKGIVIHVRNLEAALGCPVIPAVAIRGQGLRELLRTAIHVARHGSKHNEARIEYGGEVETRIQSLRRLIDSEQLEFGFPSRWIAIKLLENDQQIRELVALKSETVIAESDRLAGELEGLHKEPRFAVVASERYSLANKIAGNTSRQSEPTNTFVDKLDWITTHRIFGLATSAGVVAGLLLWTFTVGDLLSHSLSNVLSFVEPIDPKVNAPLLSILWNGVYGGLIAGVTLVIPFVVPFYFALAMIEDSGILTRVAFMMDSAMHKIGLHGKAIIPLILGYGCNVPAIYATRILETKRERLLAALAVTLAPCTARTIVILGLVATFVSIPWALSLYAADLLIIFLLGRAAMKVVPGKSTGLIMEMHSFRVPSLSVVAKQTWIRTRSIVYVVFPTYVLGSALVQGLYGLGALQPVNAAISPLTVAWLGLPAIAGALLIFGLVRKELMFLMLVAIYGTNLAEFITPVQLIVLAVVGMLYIPCLSTITALVKEFGWKNMISITAANLGSALLVGGISYRLLVHLL